MKVCDRHQDRPAVDTLVFELEDMRIDVCDECKQKINELMIGKPEKRSLVDKFLGKV